MNTHHPNYDHTLADMDHPDYAFNTMSPSQHEGMLVPDYEQRYYFGSYPTMPLDDPYQLAPYEDHGMSSMNNTFDVDPSTTSFSHPEDRGTMHNPDAHYQRLLNLDGHNDRFATISSISEQPHSKNAALAGKTMDELSLATFETFPKPESPEAPFQYQQTASDNTYNNPISIPASPVATSAGSSPQASANLKVDAVIGTIRLNGDVVCHHSACRRSFRQLAALKKHYTLSHAVQKPEFWCNVPTCAHSTLGGRPFHNVDKFRDHGRKMHQRGALRISKY